MSLALIIVLSTMSLVLVLLGWMNGGILKSIFLIVSLWLLFATLNIGRHELDVVQVFNSTTNIYNATGSLTSQENLTRTIDLTYTNSTLKLLDTANFTWLWFVVFVTGFEVLFLAFLLFDMLKGGKRGDNFPRFF